MAIEVLFLRGITNAILIRWVISAVKSSSRPPMTFNNVLLPVPLIPTNPILSCSDIDRLRSLKISLSA